jgi:uncharacterized membrane protein YGL010W
MLDLRWTRRPTRLLDHYETEHRHPVNRALHFIGIPVVLLSVIALASPWRPFGWSRMDALASLIGGWVLLFVGHAIEGNRPAILNNPAAALIGVLWWMRGWFRRPGRRGT